MEDLFLKYFDRGFCYCLVIYLLFERRVEHQSFRTVLAELVGVIKSLDSLIRERVK